MAGPGAVDLIRLGVAGLSGGPLGRAQRGIVAAFDDAVGLGTLATDGASIPFHCTAIADGTRQIAVGTAVVFRLVAGHHGVLEASDLVDVTVAAV